jgi:hypothetical protein
VGLIRKACIPIINTANSVLYRLLIAVCYTEVSLYFKAKNLRCLFTGVGWRAEVSPADHPVSQYEFDVLIGADGKRNTLEGKYNTLSVCSSIQYIIVSAKMKVNVYVIISGFGRKEFRGKLAIAITANFLNRRSEAEARVEEISGVAFIFNQKFFKDLYQVIYKWLQFMKIVNSKH